MEVLASPRSFLCLRPPPHRRLRPGRWPLGRSVSPCFLAGAARSLRILYGVGAFLVFLSWGRLKLQAMTATATCATRSCTARGTGPSTPAPRSQLPTRRRPAHWRPPLASHWPQHPVPRASRSPPRNSGSVRAWSGSRARGLRCTVTLTSFGVFCARFHQRRHHSAVSRGLHHTARCFVLIGVLSAPSGPNWGFRRARYIPVRLTLKERKRLRLVVASLAVSDYTGRIDTPALQKGAKRQHQQLKEICANFTGVLVSTDAAVGKEVAVERDFVQQLRYFGQFLARLPSAMRAPVRLVVCSTKTLAPMPMGC